MADAFTFRPAARAGQVSEVRDLHPAALQDEGARAGRTGEITGREVAGCLDWPSGGVMGNEHRIFLQRACFSGTRPAGSQ
jgi:hypothetical protein